MQHVVVDPVTRIEGHLRVELMIDEATGRVAPCAAELAWRISRLASAGSVCAMRATSAMVASSLRHSSRMASATPFGLGSSPFSGMCSRVFIWGTAERGTSLIRYSIGAGIKMKDRSRERKRS